MVILTKEMKIMMRTRGRKKDDNVVLIAALKGDIAKRAYEKFLARGGEHGHDVDDWLQAEIELRDNLAMVNNLDGERLHDQAGGATAESDFLG